MTDKDVIYLAGLIAEGYIQSPTLELGVGLEGANNKELLCKHGIDYYGTDIVPARAVDFVIKFEGSLESVRKELSSVGNLGSILAFNVLEHVFNPIKVLDNIFGVLRPAGTCAIIVPAIWPMHNFPVDCWRILPDFYVEYAKRRNFFLLQDTFQYIGYGPIDSYRVVDDRLEFPLPGKSSVHYWYSKFIHKLFNTFGRAMGFPAHVAVGVVIQKS